MRDGLSSDPQICQALAYGGAALALSLWMLVVGLGLSRCQSEEADPTPAPTAPTAPTAQESTLTSTPLG